MVSGLSSHQYGAQLRPRLRGVFHAVAAVLSLPAAVVLLVLADGGGERVAMGVYSAAITAMLGVSAVYHSGRLPVSALPRMRRLDHSTILLAIAGTYTGITWLALEGTARWVLLGLSWSAAVIGVVVRMVWMQAPHALIAALYVMVGWVALFDLPAYARGLDDTQLLLVVLGGVSYSVGGLVYGLHKPNPWPGWAGYHEVFHALVIGGVALHWWAVLGLLRAT
jgi:hemolysin III